MSIVFCCTKVRQYIYGQSITIETDHSPIVTICKINLANVPCRLQRMLIQLQSYDLSVVYIPGKHMYIADTLSRAALPEIVHFIDEEIAIHVNLMTTSLSVSPHTQHDIQETTSTDKPYSL